jgi:hypothetical protein
VEATARENMAAASAVAVVTVVAEEEPTAVGSHSEEGAKPHMILYLRIVQIFFSLCNKM